MKSINTNSQNTKFRKIVKIYIIFAVAAILLSCSLLGYAYRDKLLFAYNFNRVSEKTEFGKFNINSMKEDITKLAKQSNDVVDILILDNNNNIIYSAKGSEFAKDKEFKLKQKKDGDYYYFTYSKDKNITFKLTKRDELMLSAVWVDHNRQIQNNYRDNIFFEKNISAKKIYLLCYTFDKNTGDKIYFINDIHSVPNGPLYINIVFAVLLLILLLYWVLVAFWVYQDARKSKINYFLWGMIVLITNIAGLFVYLIYKQNNQVCPKCHALQSKGNIFCIHCGARVNNTCEYCHAITGEGKLNWQANSLVLNENYCRHCGKEIKKE